MPVTPPRTSGPTGSDRPGDRYNVRADVQDRTLDLLLRHGWTRVYTRNGVDYLRRPGKQDPGHSATLGYVAPGVLYVHSTSTEFEQGAHDPFGLYARLEHGGDFAAAARALEPPTRIVGTVSDIGQERAEPAEYTCLPPADLEPAPPRLLSPLICDSRTMWFGAQGVGKGVLLVVAIGALADGDAAFIPGSAIAAPVRVGILDWEDNRDEWSERLHRMQVPAESVPYREPPGPLTNAKVLADVRAWADGEGVELVAVDSVIPAAGGADAMKPEAPTAYYQALRELERPSLSLAHVPKDKAEAKHPFGSTYWSTPQRLVWRIERLADDSRHLIKLVNTKHSRWPWSADLFLEADWSPPGPLRIRSGLLLSLEGDPAPLIDRIVLALTVAGPLSAEAIAERVGSTPDSVRRTIGRHPKRVADDGQRPALFSPAKGV